MAETILASMLKDGADTRGSTASVDGVDEAVEDQKSTKFVHISANHQTLQVHDLTAEVTLVEQHAVAYGGCADIYHGQWVRRKRVGGGSWTSTIPVGVIRG